MDLGGERVKVRIKPGAYDGLKLRVKGKGESGKSGKYDDLYAVVKVKIPKIISSEQRKLIEQLRNTYKNQFV